MDPIVTIALIAMAPALFVVGRVIGRFITRKFDDRVVISLTSADGTVHKRVVHISHEEEVGRLIREVASKSRKKAITDSKMKSEADSR